MAGLVIERKDIGKITVLRLDGEVDLAEVPALRQRFDDLIDTNRLWIVLDMEETSYIGSSGLGLLLTVHNRVKEGNGEIKLAAPTQLARDAMHFFGLIPVLEVHDSASAAISAFAEELRS